MTEPVERSVGGLTLNPDHPVKAVDEDRFDVYPFVRRLARPLLEAPARSSLVVGLYGPWGYGKSSALNLLEIALRDVSGGQTTPQNVTIPQPVIVRFTPWLYSSVEMLLAAFFETLGAAIGGQPGNEAQRERWKGALRAMGEFVAPAMRVGTMLLPFPGGALAGKLLEAAGDALQGAAKGTAAWLDGGEVTFRQRKDEAAGVLEALSEQERPQRVVVMIDDLDRAGPEEVLAMLKLVKLAADLPNVSYVVAMDRARVAELLAATVAPPYGNDFLDKIVQIGVRLPPLGPSRLSRIAVDGAMEIARRAGMDAASLEVDWSSWEIVRASSYEQHLRNALRTPRDVVRLLNAFSFATLSSEARADVHPVDLLLICLLQIRYPTVHEAVHSNRRFLLGEEIDRWLILNRDREAHEQARAERQERLLRISAESGDVDNEKLLEAERSYAGQAAATRRPGRRPPSLEILLFLFPWALDRAPSEEEQRVARREGRIRSPERFDGYFRFEPAPDGVQLAEVEALFAVLTSSAISREYAGLQARMAQLSGSQIESLEQGLFDRAAGMNREEAAALCRNLPMLASLPDGSGAVLPFGVIGELARRSVARLRTGVYGEKVPDSERDRGVAMELLLELTRVLSPEQGSTFADEMSQENHYELNLSQDERRILAQAGLERALTELQTPWTVVADRPSTVLRDMLWRCRRLADKAGASEPRGTYGPLESYVERTLTQAPEALCDILALGAAWTGPGNETPSFEDRTPVDVRSSLARITDVKKLEVLATRAVSSGAVKTMRWPALVETMAAWAAAEQLPADQKLVGGAAGDN